MKNKKILITGGAGFIGFNLYLKLFKNATTHKAIGESSPVYLHCPNAALEIKKDIIEHLWKVLISDNTVDQYESNLMRRICGLIYFSDKECAELKLKLISEK